MDTIKYYNVCGHVGNSVEDMIDWVVASFRESGNADACLDRCNKHLATMPAEEKDGDIVGDFDQFRKWSEGNPEDPQLGTYGNRSVHYTKVEVDIEFKD